MNGDEGTAASSASSASSTSTKAESSSESGGGDPAQAPPQGPDLSKEQHIFTTNVLPTQMGPLNCCAFTHIGKRKNQEDRFVFCPDLLNGEYAFFGVFDGTVKEHASEWVHKHILPILLETPSFRKFHALPKQQKSANIRLLEAATYEMYQKTDAALIQFCARNEFHYASTTSVTALVHFPSNVMVVANLGDSHLVLGGKQSNSTSDAKVSASGDVGPEGVMVTAPHRADHPKERSRIEAAGGSVVYLHNKPFIRGGDFHYRHHAMQLNYSRAFGGKDLKPYGLSCQPNIFSVPIIFKRTRNDSSSEAKQAEQQPAPAAEDSTSTQTSLSGDKVGVILMGSDGIWDVLNPKEAVGIAYRAQQQYQQYQQRLQRTEEDAGEQQQGQERQRERPPSPAEALVQIALVNHKYKGSSDNVTALAFFL
eukprot:gb/GEZN01005715.1/.p1 GENE.gb/GEZN01005715.1/~~gb/GEZN01005715.1/.p1  ORF type:complete len:423 (+),score=76.67 gb/GEZN01005715.1/:58-1326(+)